MDPYIFVSNQQFHFSSPYNACNAPNQGHLPANFSMPNTALSIHSSTDFFQKYCLPYYLVYNRQPYEVRFRPELEDNSLYQASDTVYELQLLLLFSFFTYLFFCISFACQYILLYKNRTLFSLNIHSCYIFSHNSQN